MFVTALLDSGSTVSLAQAAILQPRQDSKALLPITCVHGDTRHVPARRVTITAAAGSWPVELGIIEDLPVPLLLGKDWPGFDQLLHRSTQPASSTGSRQRRRAGRHHARPYVFQQVTGGGSFAKAQREDDRLKNCWSQVRILEGQERQPAPHPLPHFIVQNGLLYCVAERRGEMKRLLVVPKDKTEVVMELAHAHPMARHLGAANTIQRLRDRFHWPGLDGDVKRFCQACPTCQRTAPRIPSPSPLIPLPSREMRERIERVMPLVKEHLTKAQQSQQRWYDRAAQPREFHPGDRVMVLVPPMLANSSQPGKDHTPSLRGLDREQLAALAVTDPVVVDMGEHLSAAQRTELQHLVSQFSDVFSTRPGRTTIIEHDIRTPPGVIPDGTLRFCNDFRRLNEVSEFDSHPMPCVDELLERLGRARFISTLDLTKGYWQVALTESAKPKTAFSTPSGHWQYRTLPFGLHGAPATFQRMMDVLLRPHQAYAAAYLDDVVIHSETWEEHLGRLRRVLTELRRAGLTANPRKCHLALAEAQYLGFQVGRGLIRPQQRKIEAILNAPLLKTKTQVQSDEEHPVIYVSRKLTTAETRYAAVEKEALAIKWAVLELRYYLLGR
ncbi:hypothetical protein QQF64_017407 [Cirrhinus molitorella]|uniref:Gypsy retrotransposon integrase-like protein 1 n=1 Tax=Cirrhinus molitorella TaxID=172907 RepID=A0ABR3LLS9_9TELE